MEAKFAAILVLSHCKHAFPDDPEGMTKASAASIVMELKTYVSSGTHKYIPAERLTEDLGLPAGAGVFAYHRFTDGSHILMTCKNGLALWAGGDSKAEFAKLPEPVIFGPVPAEAVTLLDVIQYARDAVADIPQLCHPNNAEAMRAGAYDNDYHVLSAMRAVKAAIGGKEPWAANARLNAKVADLEAKLETADRWRKLALQFDSHRIEAMSMLKGVVAGTVTAEDCAAFLAKPPPSGSIGEAAEQVIRAVAGLPIGPEMWDDHDACVYHNAGAGLTIGDLHKAREAVAAFAEAARPAENAGEPDGEVLGDGVFWSKRARTSWPPSGTHVYFGAARNDAPVEAPDPLIIVAEALECFWNASIGSARQAEDPTALAIAGSLSEGFAAMAARLRERAASPTEPAPAGTSSGST